MSRSARLLLILLGRATHRELARQIKYLRVENQILRSKLPRRVALGVGEKARLARFGARLGRALDQLVTIVHPDTLRRWIRAQRQQTHPNRSGGARRPGGRPRLPARLARLILRFARENPRWGYGRILGELSKLGLKAPCRNSVRNLLRHHGLEPAPRRGGSTWDEFLTRQASSLWQADILGVRAWTARGLRQLFVVVFLHVGTRRVYVSACTAHPDEAWMRDQAQAFLAQLPADQAGKFYLQHDRDTRFSADFDQLLRASGATVIPTPVRSPNLQAHVERFQRTLRNEVLDHFLICGTRHLNFLIATFVAYYHRRRPHQGRGNALLPNWNATSCRRLSANLMESRHVEAPPARSIGCTQALGGFLKHYYHRRAA